MVTSEVLRGTMQPVEKPESYALDFNRPLGVVLGIAPWDTPLNIRSARSHCTNQCKKHCNSESKCKNFDSVVQMSKADS